MDRRRSDQVRGPLAPLELDAVSIGEDVLKIPDLIGLEQLLADAGLI
jgi:chemosensory pili system protein ChpC